MEQPTIQLLLAFKYTGEEMSDHARAERLTHTHTRTHPCTRVRTHTDRCPIDRQNWPTIEIITELCRKISYQNRCMIAA